jgi:hypothetical protein
VSGSTRARFLRRTAALVDKPVAGREIAPGLPIEDVSALLDRDES